MSKANDLASLISDGLIGTAELDTGAVTLAKLSDNSVDATKLDDTDSYVIAGLDVSGGQIHDVASLYRGASATTQGGIGLGTDGSVSFMNGNAEGGRVTGEGRLGLGTQTPLGLIDLENSTTPFVSMSYGGTNANHKIGWDSAGMLISADTGGSTELSYLGLSVFGTEHVRVKHDGRVGIGTKTPSTLLHVAGTVTATNIDAANTNWDAAYSWGDHSTFNYVTSSELNNFTVGGSLTGNLTDLHVQYGVNYIGTPSQGSFFFDSLNSKLKVYTGSVWVDAVPAGTGTTGGDSSTTDANATFDSYLFTVTSATNTISGLDDNGVTLSYDTSADVEVFVNGVKQIKGASNDYVATSGTSINFVENLIVGDTVDVQVYNLLTNDAYYLKTETYSQLETNTQISDAVGNYLPLSSGTLTNQLVINKNNTTSTTDHETSSHLVLDNPSGQTKILLKAAGNGSVLRADGSGNLILTAGSKSIYFNYDTIGSSPSASGNFRNSAGTNWLSWSGTSVNVPQSLSLGASYGTKKLNIFETSTSQIAAEVRNATAYEGKIPYLNLTNTIDSDLQFFVSGNGATDKYALITPSTNTDLRLGTNGTTRMTVDSAGNIGIGTESPGSALEVVGDITVSGRVDGVDLAYELPRRLYNAYWTTTSTRTTCEIRYAYMGGSGSSRYYQYTVIAQEDIGLMNSQLEYDVAVHVRSYNNPDWNSYNVQVVKKGYTHSRDLEFYVRRDPAGAGLVLGIVGGEDFSGISIIGHPYRNTLDSSSTFTTYTNETRSYDTIITPQNSWDISNTSQNIKTSGIVQALTQPHSYVRYTYTSVAGSWQKVSGTYNVVKDTQGNFSTSTGRFTAPVAGNYLFTAGGYATTPGVNHERYAFAVYKNSSMQQFCGGNLSAADSPLAGTPIVINCAAGDYLELYMFSAAAMNFPNNGNHSLYAQYTLLS